MNGPGVLALISDRNIDRVVADTLQMNIVTDGTLLNLFGRPLLAAVGADYRRDEHDSDSSNKSGPYSLNTFTRKVLAIFGELRAPIVGSENQMIGINRLDLSFSIRHDRYKDAASRPARVKRPSQSTTNPRVGLSWSPVEGAVINASYGTSFRAPRLDILATTPAVITNTYFTPGSSAGQSYVLLLNGVDPDISSEKADTWSIGAEINPKFAPQARIYVHYFNIDFKNQVGTPPSPQILLNDPGAGDLGLTP